MAYFVIAIGGLMSVVGILAVAAGYPVIEIERGWAEVIAGSTMLAGGLLTVAIGLVLQTLLAIKRDLAMSPAAEIAAAAPPPRDTTASFARDDAPTLASGPALVASPHGAAMPLVAAHAFDEPTTPAPQTSLDTPRMLVPPAETSDPYEPAEITLAPHDASGPPPAHEAPHPPETIIAEPLTHAAAIVSPPDNETAPHPAHDGYELQTPSTPDHDLTPLAPAPASSDDWLDRAFSALDDELSAGTRSAEPAAPAPAPTERQPAALPRVEAAQAQPHGETIEAEPLAAPPALPVATQTDPPVADAAVIGRYESDGTSYIMYADGSIEAQSDAGIYRFRSMAELKAFIEG